MDYRRALAVLDRRIDHETRPRAGRIEGLSREAMLAVVAAMGDPHLAVPVVHVTGTNGKGSVVRMIEALTTVLGLRVGSFTSPHLDEPTERIRLGGEPVAPEVFAEIVDEVVRYEALAGVELTWFEMLAAGALSHFAMEGVDLAIVEVGLLGRHDATNVVRADVAVVTNVGRDHTDGRGDWRRVVASEKAGIVEAGRPLVLGETDPRLVEVFRAERPSPLWRRGHEIDLTRNDLAVGGRLVGLRTPHAHHEEVFVDLHGAHQGDNALLAVAAVEALLDRALDDGVVAEALGSVAVPGRLEILGRSPLLVVDGAHNPDGAAALRRCLETDFSTGGQRIWVVGMQDGRDPMAVFEALGVADAALVICCTTPSPRGIPAERLAEAARTLDAPVAVVPGVADALDAARDAAGDEDAVVVCGSLVLVGAARRLLID